MKLLKLVSKLSIGRLFVLAILATIGYYFSYFDDGTNLRTQIEGVNSSIGTETARRVGIEKIMKKEEEMRGNLLQLQRNLEVVKSKIPVEFLDTNMSDIINSLAKSSNINIVELNANNTNTNNSQLQMMQMALQQQSGGKNTNTVKPEDLISEVKFSMILNGNYGAFLKFLDGLSKEEKVIRIRNFTIQRNSEDIDDNKVKFKGEIIGYKQSPLLQGQVAR